VLINIAFYEQIKRENMEEKIKEFLESLVHGPCGPIALSEYEKYIRQEAKKLLNELGEKNQAILENE
jgi:hypothetical protein